MRHDVTQIVNGRTITMQANMRRRAVRIHHPELRNCVFTLTQPAVRYPDPFPCPLCQVVHIYKTFHLHLDAHGNTVVDEQIYELFRTNGIVEDLQATKEVIPRPFAIGLGPLGGFAAQPPDVISREDGLVKRGGIATIVNAITPPLDRFRRMPDGSWEEITPR